jgi:hypothetical protein
MPALQPSARRSIQPICPARQVRPGPWESPSLLCDAHPPTHSAKKARQKLNCKGAKNAKLREEGNASSTVARVQPGFHPGYGAAGEFPEEFEATTHVAAPPNPNQQPGA